MLADMMRAAHNVAASIRYPRPRWRAIQLSRPTLRTELDERQEEGWPALANACATPRELVGVAAYVELYTSRFRIQSFSLGRLMSMLRIRRYEATDLADVWRLHNAGLDQMGVHAGDGPWDDDLRTIPSTYFEAGGEFLVGMVDGGLVAMGALRRTSAHAAEVKRMRVAVEHQRRGYGRAILRALEARAIELGCSRLHLDTTSRQVPAQLLYLSESYVEVRREQRRGVELIYYDKAL